MIVECLKLRDFRNYGELELRPHPGINLLFGQNGSGKTNLLEAVHYCALGRSHRTSQDREVVRKGCDASAVGVTVARSTGRHEIAVKLMPNGIKRKQVFVDRKHATRLSDMMGRLQCVIFSPEDLMLVKDGPALRRRFLDMMLSQMSTAYFLALQQYQKALDQRNALLRDARKTGRMNIALMDAFEQGMADHSEMIVRQRKRIIDQLARVAGDKYGAISGREQELFALNYRACLPDSTDFVTKAREILAKTRQEDMLRGTTSFGVHREDMDLLLMGRDMKLFASQGQIRTAVLSMKLAQMEIFQQESGEEPVLLLDDVMSELDMTRRKRLLQEISHVQTFVTCTDESDLDGCGEKRTYLVSMDTDGLAAVKEKNAGETVRKAEEEEPNFE